MSNEHRKNLEDIINLFVKLPLIKNDVGSLEPHSTEILEDLVVRQVIPVTIDVFNIAMSNNLNYTAEIMDIINAIKKDEFAKNHFNNYIDYIGKQIIKENQSLSQAEQAEQGEQAEQEEHKDQLKTFPEGKEEHQVETEAKQTFPEGKGEQEHQVETEAEQTFPEGKEVQEKTFNEPFMSERSKQFIENLD